MNPMYDFDQQMRKPAWRPTPEVVTHARESVPREMDFFIEPPPEIGELTSVYSTLQSSKEAVGGITRLIIALGVAFVLWLVTTVIVAMVEPKEMVAGMFIGIIPGLIGLALVYYFTRFKHSCSYVGKL